MVDHYNAICKAMGMEPLPNNGSWPRTRELMTGNALRPETHVGPDKKPKTVKFNKNKNISGNKKKNVFKGKRKNSANYNRNQHMHVIFISLFVIFISKTLSYRNILSI